MPQSVHFVCLFLLHTASKPAGVTKSIHFGVHDTITAAPMYESRVAGGFPTQEEKEA